jgi:chaperonin GroEL
MAEVNFNSVLYSKEARDKVKEGINKAANMVRVTLGASGRNVIFSRIVPTQNGVQYYPARVTKDGVTVLRNFALQDPIEDIGAGIVREASKKTADIVGDGTTTTAVLVQAIVNEGLKLIDEGANPMELQKGINKAVEYVVNELKKIAIPLDNDDERIKQIATVSANNDKELGELIGNVYKTIGKYGKIYVEDAKGLETSMKIKDGIEVPQGYISPYMINNRAKGISELSNPYILFFEREIEQMQPLLPILEMALQKGAPLVIFCEDFKGEALATVVNNILAGKLNVCVIKTPYVGERGIDAMEDLALLTGGTFLSIQKGVPLQAANLNFCGSATKVIVSKESTMIIGGKGDKIKIASFVNSLQEKVNSTTNEEDVKYLENRIAALTGGVAILYVGAATASEAEEKKDRCDDAIRATRAAIDEGYVSGAGTAFIKLKDKLGLDDNSSDFLKGFNVIMDILDEPLRQICNNGGFDADKIIKEVSSSANGNGFNVLTEKVECLADAGIIDPVKVLRCSLQNAASAASMILTTEGLFLC